MRISRIVTYALLGSAAGLACLAIARGFEDSGQAGFQEAMFLTGRCYNGAANCVYSREMGRAFGQQTTLGPSNDTRENP